MNDCRYKTTANYPGEPMSMHRYYLFRMSARDLARFGLLFLREGRWKDQEILSSEWVRESTASHSVRGMDAGYGYMWWTGIKAGLLPNVLVKGHSYHASGYGGHRVIVLPYRKLVVVHRIDTDRPGKYPNDFHIGRLLWLIQAAAGEKEIGEDPSIEAAKGDRLKGEDLKELLAEGSVWAGPNNGILPGGDGIAVTYRKDGSLTISTSEERRFKGKWWLSDDRLYIKIRGGTDYFMVVREDTTIKLFDFTGTLLLKLTAS